MYLTMGNFLSNLWSVFDCGEGPVVMVGDQTYEKIEEADAEKMSDLMLKNKLLNSKKYVSYEKAVDSVQSSKS